MRVAYVCADAGVPVFGTKGCSIHVQEIVRAFLRRGDSVEIFAARTGGKAPDDLRGCIVHEFPLGRHDSAAIRETALYIQAQTIAERIDFEKFDLIYERYSLWSDETQRRAAESGTDSILEVNAPLIEEQRRHRELHNCLAAELCAVNAFQNAGRIVAVSSEVAEHVKTFFMDQTGRLLSSVLVANNGVDVDRFHPRNHTDVEQTKNCESGLTIGFVGSLKPWHGVESLLSAFQLLAGEFPDTQLKILGDGPMRERLESSLRESGVSHRICFYGVVAPEEIPLQLRLMDIAVAPYLRSEDFYFSPLKVYEYLACGLPVVASATGQLKELIEDGRNGLLYEAGNICELKATLVRLLRSRSLRMQLGAAGRATVVEHHSWQQVLERILETSLCQIP